MRAGPRFWAAWLSALCGAGACGPVEQGAEVVTAHRARPRLAPQARVRWAPSPLPMPDSALVVGRWNEPRRLLSRLQAGASEAGSFEPGLPARLGNASGPIDLAAPIEFLLVLSPEPAPKARWALSLPLEAEGQTSSSEGPRDVESPLGWACAESRALGPAPLRVVCSSSDDDLAALLPVATRALPFAPAGPGEVGLSLRSQALAGLGEPVLRAWISRWLLEALGASSSSPGFDAQLGALVESLTRESFDLARDLDGASLQLAAGEGGGGLRLSLIAPASNQRSLLGQLVAGSGAGGLAPLDFWQLRAASADAGFLWSFDAALLERWKQAFAELVFAVLDFRGVPHRLRLQAKTLLTTLPMPRGPLVHARGELPARAASSGAARLEGELGWGRFEVRGNFSEYRAYAAELVRAFEDPVLGAQLGRLLRSAFGEHWGPIRVRQRSPIEAARLPRGSFTLEVTLAPPRTEPAEEGRFSSGLRTLFVVAVPDADGIELSWGADEAFLVAADRERPSPTLASRAELSMLQRERALGGGFVSLEGLARVDDSAGASLLGIPPLGGARALLARAPHRGRSLIVYSLSKPTAGAGLMLNASLRRETVEDLVFLFAQAIAAPR